MEAATFDGVLVWKIPGFARKRQEAVAGRTPAIFSPGTGLRRAPEPPSCWGPRPPRAGACPAGARRGATSPRGRGQQTLSGTGSSPTAVAAGPPGGADAPGGRPTPAWAGCWLFLTPPLFTTSCGALTVPSGGHSGGRRVVSMLLPGSSRRGPPPEVGPGAGDVPHVTLTGTPGSPRVESGAPESGLSRRGLCPCGRAGQEGVVVPAARPWGPAPAAAAATPRRPCRRPLRHGRKCGTAQPAGTAPTRVKQGWQPADTSQRGRGGPPRGTPGGTVRSGLGYLAPSA